MRSPRFCCECGEKLFARHKRGLFARAFCKKCAPSIWRSRFMLLVTLALSIAVSFAAGRYTGSREEVLNFIGTPAELAPVPARLAENNSSPSPAQPAGGLAETGSALCGAPTKAGLPCRRRVRGGGYCFQHRDKQVRK